MIQFVCVFWCEMLGYGIWKTPVLKIWHLRDSVGVKHALDCYLECEFMSQTWLFLNLTILSFEVLVSFESQYLFHQYQRIIVRIKWNKVFRNSFNSFLKSFQLLISGIQMWIIIRYFNHSGGLSTRQPILRFDDVHFYLGKHLNQCTLSPFSKHSNAMKINLKSYKILNNLGQGSWITSHWLSPNFPQTWHKVSAQNPLLETWVNEQKHER